MSGEGAIRRIPLTLVTGFLGCGKTTLVNAVMRHPAFSGTLVIVNEFGEVGLDHLLVGSAQDQVVLLESGCLCCAASGSLRDTLIDIFARSSSGAIGPFDRIFVETSGLAHPGPLVATLLGDSAIRPRCALAQVLTLVDAVSGMDTLTAYAEARHQVAFADRLVITKSDRVDCRDDLRLSDMLRSFNPDAPIRHWHPDIPPEPLFQTEARPGSPTSAHPGVWLDHLVNTHGRQARQAGPDVAQGPGSLFDGGFRTGMQPFLHGRTSQRIATHALHLGPDGLPWTAYAAWTQALSTHLGRRLLRCKGVLRMDDGFAWVVQGVQGYFAPPERLSSSTQWSGHAFMVFILDDVAPEVLATITASIPDLPCPSSFLAPLEGNHD